MKIPKLPAGEIARRAVQAKESVEVSTKARAAAIASEKALHDAFGIKKKQAPKPEHGQQIFVFNHLQRNHVVYSLTRAMNNNAALAQLPFNGKKSVPAALRKDLWHPFAQIKFPPGAGTTGLSVFQKLREYRRRHELEWGDEVRLDEEGNARKLKDRAKAICDQKANSVADIATVLNMLAVPPPSTRVKRKDALRPGDEGFDPEVYAAQRAERMKPQMKKLNIGLIGAESGTKVEILWNDIHDAEFAEKWAENVEHSLMPPPTPQSKRWAQRKEHAALRAGEIAAKQELAEAERRWDEADPEWRSKLSPEELQTLEQEKADKIKEIEKEFKLVERNMALKAEWAEEQAAKFARTGKPPPSRSAVKKLFRKDVPLSGHRAPRSTKPQAEPLTPEEAAEREAKRQAARELYERRKAEQAERIKNDPEWYERVKAEGLKRRAEKNLL
ncbi:transcriptional regulation of mitochondrial recombination-domain-containing protein [Rhexocercosporidium sp. MPI-PUGE-AT-0058]|nr:transcriptional regulation of mitochondrial recombination-domain-containing protein [Rhexocercosporidium sp. MPI-PUGE-AT-0058]